MSRKKAIKAKKPRKRKPPTEPKFTPAIVDKLEDKYQRELPRPKRMPPIADAIEFGRLGSELKQLCPAKYDEVLIAMRKIVDAQRILKGEPDATGPVWEIEVPAMDDGERAVN